MADITKSISEPSSENKVVLLLDTTALMPVAAVQPALGAFINLLQLGDRFAILGYKGRVTRVYPARGLATYDERQVLTDATVALDALTAAGTKSNLSAGLESARKLLALREPPKAIVLVDASPWNEGSDPLLDLPDFPVETIAIGDNGQLETLREIAARTGGSYSYSADPSALLGIMLELVERLGIARIVAAGSRAVSNRQPYNLVGFVAGGTTAVTFLVFWGDPEVTYGSGSGPRYVTVDILDPRQEPAQLTPDWTGDGFAVFSVPSPATGSWSLTATYVGPGTCAFTNAILVA
jgi:hypothetical protein